MLTWRSRFEGKGPETKSSSSRYALNLKAQGFEVQARWGLVFAGLCWIVSPSMAGEEHGYPASRTLVGRRISLGRLLPGLAATLERAFCSIRKGQLLTALDSSTDLQAGFHD